MYKGKKYKGINLKVGLLSQSAIRDKYLVLKLEPGDPFWKGFAKAIFNSEDNTFYLRYLNGYIGYLRMNAEHQLEVCFFEFGEPNGEEFEFLIREEVSERKVLFSDKHLVQEVPESSLVPLGDPRGGTGSHAESNLWNASVESLLS